MADRKPEQVAYDDVTARVARVESSRVQIATALMALFVSLFVGSGQSKISFLLVVAAAAIMISLGKDEGDKLEKLRKKQGDLFRALLISIEKNGSAATAAAPAGSRD